MSRRGGGETAGSLRQLIAEDIPALLAEVSRLRLEMVSAQQEASGTLADAAVRVKGIQQRRANAFGVRAEPGAGLAGAIAEVTTPEDVDVLRAARRSMGVAERIVLDVYADVWREWGVLRCGTCLATRAQSVGRPCPAPFHNRVN